MALAERNDIHKSCKTLETVVNVLNDYCEAANAIVLLQKKLARALRDAASAKCIAEIPANALNASATIFESMVEVDTKFAKYADKECDSVSAEVKKWFKKLAKEERVHDEKIASANQKIKQAGQIYERKAKKNPRDAADEHTKYINLLSTLGPEVNREKYNHTAFVTQRHTTTMYNIAASFARVADGEWMRSCESVRRFSAAVGPLGQWRALSEGGWQGPVPSDLPDAAAPESVEGSSKGQQSVDHDTLAVSDGAREVAAPPYTSRNVSDMDLGMRAPTPSGQSPVAPPQDLPTTLATESEAHASPPQSQPPPHLQPQPQPQPQELVKEPARDLGKELTKEEEEVKPGETLGRNTLAKFPAPPTHFPVPRAGGSRFNSIASPPPQDVRADSLTEPVGDVAFPRFTESPTPEIVERTPNLTEDSISPSSSRTDPVQTPPVSNTVLLDETRQETRLERTSSRPERDRVITSPMPQRPSPSSPSAPSSYRRGDYMDDAGEFGMRRSTDSARQRSAEPPLGKIVERTDTGRSTGSMVAALRDRYANPDPSSPPPKSPPPRELPRVPGGVSSLATRYEPRQPDSPTQMRPSMDHYPRMPEPSSTASISPSTSRYSAGAPGYSAEEIALRRQRIEELEELELRERAHELRMKERDIEQRTRELERERLQLLGGRAGSSTSAVDGYLSDGGRTVPPTRTPQQRMSVDARFPSTYSTSTTHLALPPGAAPLPTQTPVPRQTLASTAAPPVDHAPSCGCETCSASKYKVRGTPSPRDLRPPEPPIQLRPEKPKGGWIRRLSMPVINGAFSADSKKGVSPGGIAGGPGYRGSLAFADEDGRLQTDLTGGIRNRSTTNVARR